LRARSEEVPVPTYTLPDLPYDFGALEPHYSAEVLELHHGKHHAAYVKGANDTIEKLQVARQLEDFDAIVGLEKSLAFNVSGHVLHSLFWRNLSPDGGGRPDGELAAAIDEGFGGFEALQKHMAATTTSVQGSGWGALAWEPMGQRLIVEQVYDHQGNLGNGSGPIFVIDAWEHAFYLQYRNLKADYVDAIWNIVDWADVAARFGRVRGLALV
jgi:Fe-Mn family superoxide dismutase